MWVPQNHESLSVVRPGSAARLREPENLEFDVALVPGAQGMRHPFNQFPITRTDAHVLSGAALEPRFYKEPTAPVLESLRDMERYAGAAHDMAVQVAPRTVSQSLRRRCSGAAAPGYVPLLQGSRQTLT